MAQDKVGAIFAYANAAICIVIGLLFTFQSFFIHKDPMPYPLIFVILSIMLIQLAAMFIMIGKR